MRGPAIVDSQSLPIYLDYLATTPVDPRVVAAMTPYFSEEYGNPSSGSHLYGWQAKNALEKARKIVAQGINAKTPEIIFTSGASEGNNMVLKGVEGRHIITTNIEHKCILNSLVFLEKRGMEVTYIPVEKSGLVDPQKIAAAIRPDTVLVSVMMANNEIGTINPISEIGEICHKKKVLFHTDAAQAVGKIPVDVEKMHVDLLSMSAHKFYGPKGVGALYIRREIQDRLHPLIHGGGQERGLRSGTHNLAGIVGMAHALELCLENMESENKRIRGLRDRLYQQLKNEIPGIKINGCGIARLCHNLHLTIPGVEAEELMLQCKNLAFSASSACASGSQKPSYVLTSIGLDPAQIHCSFRLSLGRFTTEEHLNFIALEICQAVSEIQHRYT
jgi:cysteine desulfurase